MKRWIALPPARYWSLHASLLWIGLTASAQCPNTNTLVGSAITVPCPGTVAPAPCLEGGEYALVNVTNGNTYTFSTCGQNNFNTFLTLRNNAGGAVLGYDGNACGNQSSITWTATFNGAVRILVNRQRPWTDCDDSNSCTPVTISCTGPPANDDPCGAIALTVGTACNGLSTPPSNLGATATSGVPAPGCAGYSGGDVWFTVTIPASGSVTVTTTSVNNSPFVDSGLALYASSNGTCSGTFSLVAGSCNDDIDFPYNEMSSTTVTGQTPGAVLFVRVWEAGNNRSGRFNICATNLPGDAPCQATTLAVNSSCTYVSATNQGATRTTSPGNPGCNWNTGTARDIWFTFTAPANGHVAIQSQAGSLTDGSMALYSTSNNLCTGSWTMIECDDDDGLGTMPLIDRTGLTPGRPYWIRYWGYGGSQGSFNICLYSPAANPTSDCAGGFTVCDAQNVSNNALSTGNTNDLNSGNRGCLLDNERQGTWFAYQAGANGSLGFSITPVASDDYDFAIWGPYPMGSTTATMCRPASGPIRCSYAQRSTTFAATGGYATGMGHSNTSFNNPRFAPPTPVCGSCSENLNGDGWVPGINVTAGEVYLLYVDNWGQSGSAFDLSWTLLDNTGLPNPDLLNCAVVLPVELLSLQAETRGPMIDVTWATASESNSDHFKVQRSADNVHFETIGLVAAAGHSQQRIDYLFVDKQPMVGANYYRLDQVDLDGTSELTHTVVAVFGRDGLVPLLFPNPAHDVLHVAFDTPVDGYTLLYVRDALGRVVEGPEVLLERGQRTVDLPTGALAPGFYTLRVALADGKVLNGGGFMKQ